MLQYVFSLQMARTQKNKATSAHLGSLKVTLSIHSKLARRLRLSLPSDSGSLVFYNPHTTTEHAIVTA